MVPTMAQDKPAFDISSLQASAGYSLRVFTQANYTRIGMSGWYGSADYKIFRWLSAAADFSGNYRNKGDNGNVAIYSGLAGPRFYPFGHRKVSAFGEFLVGDSHYRVHFPAFGGFPAATETDSEFSWAGGGGIDYSRSKRWAIRIVEADYQRTGFFGGHQNNYRLSIGFVYHFGQK
jgi:hypothetical protein